jgi:hypothetical protein
VALNRTTLDNDWLTKAIREYDLETANKEPYDGYSPFRCDEAADSGQGNTVEKPASNES